MELGIIYLAINKTNRFKYVGQTWRWKQRHRLISYYDSERFYNALVKYGWDNFEWIILFNKIETQEELDWIEQETIALYDSANRNKGYNIRLGGSTGKLSEQSKQKISKANKGLLAGKNNPNFGKPRSEEIRRKISITHKNKHKKFSNKEKEEMAIKAGSKPFNVYKKDTNELVGTWVSKRECVRKLQCDRAALMRCLKGKVKSHNNYMFKYTNNYLDISSNC